MDYRVKLPGGWRYVDQFAPSAFAPAPSHERCGPAATVMATEFADPGEFVPAELEHQLYTQWAGPDVPTNLQGTTLPQIKQFLDSEKLAYIDMQHLVDEFNAGNHEPLRQELGHQNEQGVAQIVTVRNMGALHEAVLQADGSSLQGASLYPWEGHGEGVSHVIFRIGAGVGVGLYADSAAPSFCIDAKGAFRPARVLWTDLIAAGLWHVLAIMPQGVAAPPAGFSFVTGTWPEPPKPALDKAQLKSDLEAFKQQVDQERAAGDATFLKIIAELSA